MHCVAKLTHTVPDGGSGTVAKSKSFTLDPSGRLSATSDETAGVELRKTVNHYADGGDAPAWINLQTRADASAAWSTSWSRNVLGPDGDLSLIEANSWTPQIQITNLHGDVVAQVPNSTGAVTGIDAWAETSEYGLAKADSATLGQNYGWLGAKRRSTDTIGGLTLMGVRLYNPTTGRFLSRDPVPGGNDNTYTYPSDTTNSLDLDGKIKWNKKFTKVFRKAKKLSGKYLGPLAFTWCYARKAVKIGIRSKTPWGDIWQTYCKPVVIAFKCWNPFG